MHNIEIVELWASRRSRGVGEFLLALKNQAPQKLEGENQILKEYCCGPGAGLGTEGSLVSEKLPLVSRNQSI